MKTIKNLNPTRLTDSEFNQHIKNICNNIIQLGEDFITDENLINFINDLNHKLEIYETSALQLTKSTEAVKILNIEEERENSVTSALRLLNVFELSDNPQEQQAWSALHTIFEKFKQTKISNFEEETTAFDTLVNELNSPKWEPQVTILRMEPYIMGIQIANSIFKSIYAERTQEIATKEIYDLKTLRHQISSIYEDMAQYVCILSRIHNTEEYNKPLHLINTIREYYADLLSKRSITPIEISEPTKPVSQN